jgi:hypothetical protein
MSYIAKVLQRLEQAPEFLSSGQVAKILEIEAATFNRRRGRRGGPPFEQLPGCRPIYNRADLIAWVKCGTTYRPRDMDRSRGD